ncbi:hypothetical protein HanRHA438_Chr09g0424701 [Helianthus annuus]|nr:hypothetical protein HanRHA438_Chr09g0424701 [Helianthus annuus]
MCLTRRVTDLEHYSDTEGNECYCGMVRHDNRFKFRLSKWFWFGKLFRWGLRR